MEPTPFLKEKVFSGDCEYCGKQPATTFAPCRCGTYELKVCLPCFNQIQPHVCEECDDESGFVHGKYGEPA